MTEGDSIVKIRDIAKVVRTYKKPHSITRFNGKKVVTLQIIKRSGTNLLLSVEGTKLVVKEFKKYAPNNFTLNYSGNQAKRVKSTLHDLQNNLISAIILVMLIILIGVGWRSSILVGIAIPMSFLLGIFIINLLGCTINIVVLFGLILSIGMLVDGAIIVVEDADRHMAVNVGIKDAFINAGQRMFLPVLTSIATTLVVFIPLLFWPGTMGRFMRFLPMTLIATLGSSLLVATILIPIIGSFIGGVRKSRKAKLIQQNIEAIDKGDFANVKGFTACYIKLLQKALNHPAKVVFGSFTLLILIIVIYGKFGRGVEFFVAVEPEIIPLTVISYDSLSLYNKDKIVKEILTKIKHVPGIKSINSAVNDNTEKNIAYITINLEDWDKRNVSYYTISKLIDSALADIPGINIKQEMILAGPLRQKPISFNLIGNISQTTPIAQYITEQMRYQ